MSYKIKEVFKAKYFVYTLTVWLMLNSIKFVSLNKYSQGFSILLGLWGIMIIVFDSLSSERSPFNVPGVGLAIPFIIAVFLSFVGNGFNAPVKNLYSVIAVSINFLVLYTFVFQSDKKELIMIMKLILIGTTLINLINLVMLAFRVSFEFGIGDSAVYIGFDSLRGRMTGLSGNANGLSRVGLSGILAAAYILSQKEEVSKRFIVITYVALVLNVITALLSQSRAGIYSISLALAALFFAYFTIQYKKQLVLKLISIPVVIVVFFAFSSILTNVSYLLVENYPSINLNIKDDGGEATSPGLVGRDDEATNDDLSNGRTTLIKNGVNATLEMNPIFGLSYSSATEKVGQYIDSHDIVIPDHLKTTVGSMHNTFVQSFVYYGFLGFIPLMVFFIYVAQVFLRQIFVNDSNEVSDKMTFYYISFALGLLITMNMVEWIFVFDFDNHLINLIMFLTLGLLIKTVQLDNEKITYSKIDCIIKKPFKKVLNKVGGYSE